jgi:hypothetical protein
VDEIQYLKIDLSMPDSFGKALWLPSLHDATSFKTKAEAQSVKNMMPNSSGVFEAGNGLFYVMRVWLCIAIGQAVMEEMAPDEVQRAEIKRLTKLLFEKAARLNIRIAPHSKISGSGKVTVWGQDLSEPVTSPGRIVFPE